MTSIRNNFNNFPLPWFETDLYRTWDTPENAFYLFIFFHSHLNPHGTENFGYDFQSSRLHLNRAGIRKKLLSNPPNLNFTKKKKKLQIKVIKIRPRRKHNQCFHFHIYVKFNNSGTVKNNSIY